jgi:TolB-like protein
MSPSEEDVRRQLDRLLASAPFANAGRMSRFLRFVVEQALAGDGGRLKEYVIGIEVFDRDADYDPRVDSIVRVEAARLRAKLAEYHAGEGIGDPVVLTLPKGGYAPVAIFRGAAARLPGEPAPAVSHATTAADPPAQPASRSRRGWALGTALAGAAALAVGVWAPWGAPSEPGLRVAVMPFAPYTDDADEQALAMKLTEGVTAELVRSGRFAVVASTAARAVYAPDVRPRDLAEALAADVLIEARVTGDGKHVRVEARAVDGRLEQKLWVQGFAGPAPDTRALEREMATAVTAALSALDLYD